MSVILNYLHLRFSCIFVFYVLHCFLLLLFYCNQAFCAVEIKYIDTKLNNLWTTVKYRQLVWYPDIIMLSNAWSIAYIWKHRCCWCLLCVVANTLPLHTVSKQVLYHPRRDVNSNCLCFKCRSGLVIRQVSLQIIVQHPVWNSALVWKANLTVWNCYMR